MPISATSLSDRHLKTVKATDKDFVLSDGGGLQPPTISISNRLLAFSILESIQVFQDCLRHFFLYTYTAKIRLFVYTAFSLR